MFDASTLEVFIASTIDLKEELRAVEEVLRDWNTRNARKRQIMLVPLRWGDDSTPPIPELNLPPVKKVTYLFGEGLSRNWWWKLLGGNELKIERFGFFSEPFNAL